MRKIFAGSTLVAVVAIFTFGCTQKKDYKGWPQYKGSNENIHYSSLKQVDTSNVKQLQVAWTYHTRDADSANHSQIQCNPIVIDGVMYGTTPKMKLFAIDAATGHEKWQFNPFDSLASDKRMFFIMNNSRGVAYWSSGDDKRVFYAAGPYLYCINAATGKTVNSFGDKGKIDLHDGLGRDVADLFVTASSPPIIYGDIMIMGTRVDEGSHAAPGHIRAYNVRTGKQFWIFHTIPHPGEPGYETWEDPNAYKFIGGANVWSGFSLDEKRGIVYGCTGSASYDWYGGNRLGNNLYADCLLALDAKTGKLIWHFQDIHHDVWDKDIPSAPALVTIKKDGKDIEAVAIATKTGFIFTFDRVTGKPVYDIVEKPVPTFTDLAGEKLSKTQPYPTLPAPFMSQRFNESDINPYLPDSSKQQVLKAFRNYKTDHMFNSISLQGTVVYPGLDGGAEWGGPSYDPESGILYVNANQTAWIIQAIPLNNNKEKANETNLQAGQRLFKANCMTCHGADRKGSGTFPSLINIERKYKPAAFDTLLQSGRRMMPAFRQLKAAERKAIASYVLNISAEQLKPFINADSHKDDMFKVPYSIVGYNKFLSKEGYPAIAPPWGTLNAINLNTGKLVWRTTLGNDPVFPHGKDDSGTENYGASVITKGGLLFIAATKDGKFRAFNKKTGKLLWEVSLPAPGYATPSVYELNCRQYIVIACGGGKMNTPSGDSYVAFALPSK
ncbi:PQQ-binding-like beta-propeller repeat protein [Mucilaginibacter rigui]|uniref:PQQ-binding-like beta-propeller repeat protein n=1 Tax=Mucilaginibacter rigui TaxID=534635 RepID=A0ABR7X9W6_9SPHI|nr:PQQ-binding-like beta-propeller repeat protein [Mucilaginibacter rigui]MBD1387374.1 PQQ-binding-like beta-propeller repeat protein [Mucilaginibacter rigui]